MWGEMMVTDEYKDKQRRLAKYQAEARKKPTAAEAIVKSALDNIGINYVFQKGFLRGKTIRLVDFYFPGKYRICLEVDGEYHDLQKDYDDYRERKIIEQRKFPLRFVRVPNSWVFEMSGKNMLEDALKSLIFY